MPCRNSRPTSSLLSSTKIRRKLCVFSNSVSMQCLRHASVRNLSTERKGITISVAGVLGIELLLDVDVPQSIDLLDQRGAEIVVVGNRIQCFRFAFENRFTELLWSSTEYSSLILQLPQFAVYVFQVIEKRVKLITLVW